MLAATPPMGWNSWNTFGPNIDEVLVDETATALVDRGLLAAGYDTLVIDDGWMATERVDGRLVPDPDRFPSGMKRLVDRVHARGLKFGIYSCAGTHTCERLPASYGFEHVDAATFAEWEVDFLKYDFCYTAAGSDAVSLYRRMGQALRATGRPIIYSICEWGQNRPWEWAPAIGAHMWRTTDDIFDSWDSVTQIGFEANAALHPYAGPGRWNDPDMLVVGMGGEGHVARGGMTDAEYRSHFALWCMQASPLMIGCDVRTVDAEAISLLSDPGLIAIDQDPLGRQGSRLQTGGHVHGEIWTKPLGDGSWAVAFFNNSDRDEAVLSIGWESLGMPLTQPADVVGVTGVESASDVITSTSAVVGRNDVAVVVVRPQL